MRQVTAASGRPAGMWRTCAGAALLVAIYGAAAGQSTSRSANEPGGAGATAPPATTSPASAPAAGRQPFQPGVELDWAARRVYLRARVVLREGPLEYFACFRGKEHESILRLECRAEHVYLALGLLGYEPGAPARWNEDAQRFDPPSGALLDVLVAEPGRAGRNAAPLPAHAWLKRLVEGGPVIPRPWVFAGSRRGADGTLLADQSGAGLALVDAGDALLALSQNHSDSDASLWAGADPQRVPPLNAEVELILGPPTPPPGKYSLTADGAVRCDGIDLTLEDWVDLLTLRTRLSPRERVQVECAATTGDHVRRLQAELRGRGVDPDAIDWEAAPPAP